MKRELQATQRKIDRLQMKITKLRKAGGQFNEEPLMTLIETMDELCYRAQVLQGNFFAPSFR